MLCTIETQEGDIVLLGKYNLYNTKINFAL